MSESQRIRRAVFSVSDKTGVVELAKAFCKIGTEIVATGRTASVLKDAGIPVIPIEKISGSPEAFQGRMKSISFPVCSGILYRRGDPLDEEDLQRLAIQPIDCVVVNFYPFEQAARKLRESGSSSHESVGAAPLDLVEQIDIGGPTLVRAAAKNAPDVAVLTDPAQYPAIIEELKTNGTISRETSGKLACAAWKKVLEYDTAIERELGGRRQVSLRYGENPHQKGFVEIDPDGPIAWPVDPQDALTSNELSYNNILDMTACYSLLSDLKSLYPDSACVVVMKHQNPCGVAVVPHSVPHAQKAALAKAWEGDPVSAFGGVIAFGDPLNDDSASWLSDKFVELIGAPALTCETTGLKMLTEKRKKLKAVNIRRFGDMPREMRISIPGGILHQTMDNQAPSENLEALRGVTEVPWPAEKSKLARFGIAICRALKSNAVALVRDMPGLEGGLQLVGAGQGQPNRVEALEKLAIPRAQAVLRASEGKLSQCVLVSDAFFPFRDAVDVAYAAGIRLIVQPGGSIKDSEVIAACNEHRIAMAFTGTRHFRH